MPAKTIKRNRYDLAQRLPYAFRYLNSFSFLTIWTVFMVFFISRPAIAQDRLLKENASEGPFQISADEIEYDTAENLYIARGNVIITKNGDTLTAEEIRYNPKTLKASASGNVIFTSGEDIITGSHMEMDFGTDTGHIDKGDLFFKTNHFYVTGDSIQKIGKGIYSGKHVTLTACDGKPPAWKITGKHLNVELEGYGYATHTTLWLKNIPVFYTPFLVFPIKTNRQSGLLTPEVDYSERFGFAIDQPLFWAINDNSDATFYVNYLSLRGTKFGFEYRYILNPLSKGTVMLDVLNDRKIDNGQFNSSRDWGYEDDTVLRPNTDRYWFRMKQDYTFENGLFGELDLDIVSDQDYLHEFRDGYSGYKETYDYFNNTFKRTLDRSDDPVRTNRLNLNKSWGSYQLNGEFLWYDNVIQRRQGNKNTTLQQLPFIEFNMIRQQILNSFFYQDLTAAYTHFYREEGTRGHRLDTRMGVYFPYRIKNIIALESSLGLRGTTWYIDKYQDTMSNKDRTFVRGIYDLRFDLSTELYRIFDLAKTPAQRIKHIIRPEITYQYTPNQSQDKYPQFDSLDRISEKNLLTYSVNTLLISRSDKKGATGPMGLERISRPDYSQFFRLEIEQQYDINKANRGEPEPFSPVYTRLEFTPTRHVALNAESQWSAYQSRFISRNLVLDVRDNRSDRLFVEYRHTEEEVETNNVESINVLGDLKISQQISVYGGYERNIYDGRTIKKEIGLLYQAQCWLVNLLYYEEENNFKIRLSFKLKGLGEIGE